MRGSTCGSRLACGVRGFPDTWLSEAPGRRGSSRSGSLVAHRGREQRAEWCQGGARGPQAAVCPGSLQGVSCLRPGAVNLPPGLRGNQSRGHVPAQ